MTIADLPSAYIAMYETPNPVGIFIIHGIDLRGSRDETQRRRRDKSHRAISDYLNRLTAERNFRIVRDALGFSFHFLLIAGVLPSICTIKMCVCVCNFVRRCRFRPVNKDGVALLHSPGGEVDCAEALICDDQAICTAKRL